MINKKTVKVEAKIDNIHILQEMTEEFLDEIGCPPKAAMSFQVAIDEIASNVVFYAYGEDNTGELEFIIEYDDNKSSVAITFIDEGMEYDPLKKEDPDITLSVDERAIGGLGIFMVKKMMDNMTYLRESGKNILTIEKKIS